MYRRLVMVSVAMVLAVVCSATAQQPEAPKIVSWSNSKTAGSKTVFQVKPGEKITFSVKADGAEEYRWWVNKNIQEGVKGESFKWTVPNERGLWKIHVTVTNSPQEQEMKKIIDVVRGTKKSQKWDNTKPGNWGWGRWPWMLDAVYPSKAQKEWIVSTYLKEVKPGESIQAAIDSVPTEGGIVQLAAGKHEIPQAAGTLDLVHHCPQRYSKGEWTQVSKRHYTSPVAQSVGNHAILLKRRKNIAICGAGMDRTTLINTTDRVTYSIFFLLECSGITFRDMLITARKPQIGRDQRGDGLKLWKCEDIALSDVKVEKYTHAIGGSVSHYSAIYKYHRTDNLVLSNCILTRCGYAINWTFICNSIIKDTEISHNRGDGVGFNSNSSLHVVVRCRCHHNGDDGINTYSNMHFVLKDNICYENGSHGIEVQTYTDDVRIMDNVCRDNGREGRGGGGIGIVINSGSTVPDDIIISNNVCYNNKGPGVNITPPRRGGSITRKGGPFHITIESNTIFSNKGDGIVNPVNAFEIIIRDNIIVNNAGYGISQLNDKSTLKLSRNNVLQNAKGNYNRIPAGAGDMSVDPLFADPVKGDFHLKSKAGRWDPKAKKWVKDNVHSPCIDAGDPKAEFSKEPAPNGGRVNVGAYGNTSEASKSIAR